MPKAKRKVEVLVLSDIHLGTFGCHATALLDYLKSVEPDMVILNEDETVDALCFQGELRHGQIESPQFTCCK